MTFAAATWEIAQAEEAAWWGDCVNTYQEETKQRELFAPRLGLEPLRDPAAGGRWPVYDLGGRSVLDVGSGPCSILLKCANVGDGTAVLDPCPYPDWVWGRYAEAGLAALRKPAEALEGRDGRWDEAWIYNTLQHVHDPALVVSLVVSLADWVKVVEWVEIPEDDAHPHRLTADRLDSWLGIEGRTDWVPEAGATLYHGWAG